VYVLSSQCFHSGCRACACAIEAASRHLTLAFPPVSPLLLAFLAFLAFPDPTLLPRLLHLHLHLHIHSIACRSDRNHTYQAAASVHLSIRLTFPGLPTLCPAKPTGTTIRCLLGDDQVAQPPREPPRRSVSTHISILQYLLTTSTFFSTSRVPSTCLVCFAFPGAILIDAGCDVLFHFLPLFEFCPFDFGRCLLPSQADLSAFLCGASTNFNFVPVAHSVVGRHCHRVLILHPLQRSPSIPYNTLREIFAHEWLLREFDSD
jgi:hypothetical protein